MELSLLGSLLGGVLALLSPCSVMVLPAFFAFAFNSAGELIARAGAFFLGLAASLVPLGLLAGTLGAWVAAHRFSLMTIVLVCVVVLGVIMLLGIPVPAFTKQQSARGTSVASVFSLGAVYGLAGGCAGPVFGAVLAMAAFGGNALMGGITMLVYAAGMTVPLLLLALLWNRIPGVRRLIRPRELAVGRWRNAWSNIIAGVITISLGVFMIVTDGASRLNGFMTASDQAALEGRVMNATSHVSDLAVLAGAVVIALAVWIGYRVNARLRTRSVARRTHEAASQSGGAR